MKAVIKSAKLKRIDEIWKKHKPQGLGFSDTDVIVLKLKPQSGKIFNRSFYCRIKADGTLGHSTTRASERRQQYLKNFIKKFISKANKYNVKENLDKWKGKKVEVETVDGIFVLKM